MWSWIRHFFNHKKLSIEVKLSDEKIHQEVIKSVQKVMSRRGFSGHFGSLASPNSNFYLDDIDIANEIMAEFVKSVGIPEKKTGVKAMKMCHQYVYLVKKCSFI